MFNKISSRYLNEILLDKDFIPFHIRITNGNQILMLYKESATLDSLKASIIATKMTKPYPCSYKGKMKYQVIYKTLFNNQTEDEDI